MIELLEIISEIDLQGNVPRDYQLSPRITFAALINWWTKFQFFFFWTDELRRILNWNNYICIFWNLHWKLQVPAHHAQFLSVPTKGKIKNKKKKERREKKKSLITNDQILAALNFLIFPHLLDIPPQVLSAGHIDKYPESILNHLDQLTSKLESTAQENQETQAKNKEKILKRKIEQTYLLDIEFSFMIQWFPFNSWIIRIDAINLRRRPHRSPCKVSGQNCREKHQDKPQRTHIYLCRNLGVLSHTAIKKEKEMVKKKSGILGDGQEDKDSQKEWEP